MIIGNHKKLEKQFLAYKGIPIMADYFLHEKVFEEFVIFQKFKNIPKQELRILILGSGKGAFDKRLLDCGFSNITSVDINSKNYPKQLREKVKFIQYDLNKDFKFGKFDVIFALEIIEHLENINKFLKNCATNLVSEGYLFVSTPNIHEKTSRIMSLLYGAPPSFSSQALQNSGHITPVIDWIFKYYARMCNLEIIKRTYNRKYFDVLPIYSFRSIVYYFLLFLLSSFLSIFYRNKKLAEGVISIYILQKNRLTKIKNSLN